MRDFNYSLLKDLKWDSEIVSYLTAIHEAKGKQELYLKQQPEKLNKLVEIAKIQSTESSNDIEGIRTTNTRLKQLLTDKTTPKNRDEEEYSNFKVRSRPAYLDTDFYSRFLVHTSVFGR